MLWKKPVTAGEVDTTENNSEIVLRNRPQTLTELQNIQALSTLYVFVG